MVLAAKPKVAPNTPWTSLGATIRILMLVAAVTEATSVAVSGSTPRRPKHIAFLLIDDYGFADASYKNGMYPGAAAARCQC